MAVAKERNTFETQKRLKEQEIEFKVRLWDGYIGFKVRLWEAFWVED